MLLSNSEIRILCRDNTVIGGHLALLSPDKRRRTVFFPGKATCAVCGRGITDRDWRLYQTCDFWKCRAQHRCQQRTLRKETDERKRRQREEFTRQVGLLCVNAAGRLGIDRPESFLPAVVPSIQRPVTRLSQERLSALDDRLKSLIAVANEKRKASPGDHPDEAIATIASDANAKPLPIVQEACAMCRGRCCVNGGNSAYLTQEVISRFLSRHPELGPNEVHGLFMSHVEEHTIENSCIFHGKKGCSLPRALRSDTCNLFECAGLRRLQPKFSGPGPHRVFFVASENNRVVRYAFRFVP